MATAKSTTKATTKATQSVVNMHEAKTHLSRLVERVESGEEIIIGRAGKPVARLVPYQEQRPGRSGYGALKGKLWIADDFDDDLPADVLDGFYGDL